MATLVARSVVGLAEVGLTEEEEDEADPMLDALDDEKILRITAIHNRFDASYDDGKSGGYRHLSISVEVMIPFLPLCFRFVSALSLPLSLSVSLTRTSLSLSPHLFLSLSPSLSLSRWRR